MYYLKLWLPIKYRKPRRFNDTALKTYSNQCLTYLHVCTRAIPPRFNVFQCSWLMFSGLVFARTTITYYWDCYWYLYTSRFRYYTSESWASSGVAGTAPLEVVSPIFPATTANTSAASQALMKNLIIASFVNRKPFCLMCLPIPPPRIIPRVGLEPTNT